MKLKIITYPSKILTKKTKQVGQVNDEIRKLIDDMAETMYGAPGVGLAANQVGASKQIAVVDTGDGLRVFLNPKITKKSGLVKGSEGCLSLPGVELEINRPARVEASYLDKVGQPQKLKAKGLLARVICHEVDHLNGKLIIDRRGFWQKMKYKLGF